MSGKNKPEIVKELFDINIEELLDFFLEGVDDEAEREKIRTFFNEEVKPKEN